MLTFKEFYHLAENLYSQATGLPGTNIYFHDDIAGADNNTPLGAPSNIQGDRLIAKFANEWFPIRGEFTSAISKKHTPYVYMAYRIIQDLANAPGTGARIYALGTIKGTANLIAIHKQLTRLVAEYELDPDHLSHGDITYLAQEILKTDNLNNINNFVNEMLLHGVLTQADQQPYRLNPQRTSTHQAAESSYYQKEHYTLSNNEYNALLDKAVDAFALKIRSRKYGMIVYPESRSRNVIDICEKLAQIIGVGERSYGGITLPGVEIVSYDKIVVTEDSVERLFQLDEIVAELLSKAFPEQKTTDLKDKLKQYLLNRFNNRTLSTAGDTRPTHATAIVNGVGTLLNATPADIPYSGRLDRYANPHFHNERLIAHDRYNKVNQIITRMKDKLSQIDDQQNIARRSGKSEELHKLQTQAEKLNTHISNVKNENNILFVDDNINTGDIFKQVTSVVNAPIFRDVRFDFFYLMCREEYAKRND